MSKREPRERPTLEKCSEIANAWLAYLHLQNVTPPGVTLNCFVRDRGIWHERQWAVIMRAQIGALTGMGNNRCFAEVEVTVGPQPFQMPWLVPAALTKEVYLLAQRWYEEQMRERARLELGKAEEQPNE